MKRLTKYDKVNMCFKSVPDSESGRSVIQELGIYEDIHQEEIEKARNITDIRDLYFTKGAKLDPYWENLGKPKTGCSDWIPVSEGLPQTDMTVLIQFSGHYDKTVFAHAFSTAQWWGEDEGWDVDALNCINGTDHDFTVEAWRYIPDMWEGDEKHEV